jgi:hypothetical protein
LTTSAILELKTISPAFGSGGVLRRAAIEITDDPVTTGVANRSRHLREGGALASAPAILKEGKPMTPRAVLPLGCAGQVRA